MAITEDDVRFRASQRMTDFADGGGRMSTTVVVDGADNNVFDDITDVERLQGHLSLRKVFAAVLNAGNDAYRSAHVFLDDGPDDAAAWAYLFRHGGLTTERAEVAAAVASGGVRIYGVSISGGASTGAAITVNEVQLPLAPAGTAVAAVSGAVTSAELQYESGWYPVTGCPLIESHTTEAAGPDGWTNVYFGTPLVGGGAESIDGSISGTYQSITAGTVAFAETSPVTVPYVGGVPDYVDGSITGTYSIRVSVPLPRETASIIVTAENRAYMYTFSIPAGSAPGSESVFTDPELVYPWTPTLTQYVSFKDVDAQDKGTINRTTGAVTVLFATLPPVGTEIQCRFARGTSVAALGSGALSDAGVVTGGAVTVSLTSGKKLAAAVFMLPTVDLGCRLYGTGVFWGNNIRGSVNRASGLMSLPFDDGGTITQWHGFEGVIDAVSSATATLPASMAPDTVTITGQTSAGVDFSATASAGGTFSTSPVSGTYTASTGETALTFSSLVDPTTLAYTGTVVSGAPIIKPIFAPGDAVLVHHTDAMAPAAVSNGHTVDTGRTGLARLRVRGNNGVVHARFTLGQPDPVGVGCAADLAAGTVSFSDVSGMSQPVTVEHRIEEMVLLQAVNAGTDVLTLNRALSRSYPAGTKVSSLMMLGDLQGRTQLGFSQQAWTDVWDDARIGGDTTADFNLAGHPIVCTNAGAVTERWACIFTNTTTYRCIGETLGEIGTGSTGADYSPINPATGEPYFTIPAAGWGGGWSAGNVWRHDTAGANSPLWGGRGNESSVPTGTDSVTLQLRGYVNS